jgi:glycosyltransferase involved in cell wall biosynthesis
VDRFAEGVSVVVPVFRSTTTLVELVSRVHSALGSTQHQLLLVDDGSGPDTWETILGLASTDNLVIGVRLGRNFGQHSALLAGLRLAEYSVTVTLDDDLQNPPEEIPKLLANLDEGIDVVYGTPKVVAQRRWRAASSLITRTLLASSLGASNAAHMSSFRAFRTSLRNGFEADLGPAVSLDALLSWSTSRFAAVEIAHHARSEGKSNYSFRKLMRFAFDTATGYSSGPLQAATLLGLVTAAFGVGVLGYVLARIMVADESVPGFAFLVSIITIFAGVQFIALGVIGEYLARMHFRVMRKPTFVIAESTLHKQEDQIK